MAEPLPSELETLLKSLETDTFYGRDYPLNNPPDVVAGSSPWDAPFRLTYTPLNITKKSKCYEYERTSELTFDKNYNMVKYSSKLSNGADLSTSRNDEALKFGMLAFDPRWVMRKGEYIGKIGNNQYKFKIDFQPEGSMRQRITYVTVLLDDGRLRGMDMQMEFGTDKKPYSMDCMAIEFAKESFRNFDLKSKPRTGGLVS